MLSLSLKSVTNAFCLGLVFVSLYIIFINFIAKTPSENYSGFHHGKDVYFETDDISSPCINGYTKIGRLCAPSDNLGYQKELQSLQDKFEHLIHMYDPVQNDKPCIERKIKDRMAFDELIGNKFWSERLETSSFVGTHGSNIAGLDTTISPTASVPEHSKVKL